MKPPFRPGWRTTAMAVATLGVVSGGAAFANWSFGRVMLLEPGFGGECEGCDLSGRLLVGARLANSAFRDAKFTGAVMTRVDAEGSMFEGADFTNAILDDADFSNASLGRARMSGARMAGADFSGADLRAVVGLTQEQLSEACGDRATELPRGLRIPRCRKVAAP